MLVLSRKERESLTLFDHEGNEVLTIAVSQIRGKQVRIAIGNSDFIVHRTETVEQKKKNGTLIEKRNHE